MYGVILHIFPTTHQSYYIPCIRSNTPPYKVNTKYNTLALIFDKIEMMEVSTVTVVFVCFK